MAQMSIDGEFVDSLSGKSYAVSNPATGETVDSVPLGTVEDARRAIDAAEAAFGEWSQTSAEHRGKVLLKAVELIRERHDELAVLLTKEQGKPVTESRTEIEHFLHGMEFYAGLASKVRGAYVPLPDTSMYGLVIRQPIGVCAAIVPWNFPITLMGTKVNPALAAGNTVVVKPASTTPLTALQIVALMHQAGIPNGVLNLVTGPGSMVGEELIQNPKVRRIGFTGETATGRHVGEVAGRELKRLTLELGGSDPMIVCDDADLDKAAAAAAIGRFFNCGQACLAVKRLYVFEPVYQEFVSKLTERVKRLTNRMGGGMTEGVRLGPLHNAQQRQEIADQVGDALERGGRVLIGGAIPEGDAFEQGSFYLPTLLEDVDRDSRMAQEEVFGPALPIWKVKDLDEAVERANDSPYGLGSSMWTGDLTKARRGAERIQAGNVWINSLHVGFDEMPFGGVKSSGLGREHGPESLDYYTETKGIVIATG